MNAKLQHLASQYLAADIANIPQHWIIGSTAQSIAGYMQRQRLPIIANPRWIILESAAGKLALISEIERTVTPNQ